MPTEEKLYGVYPRGHYPWSVEQIRELARVRQELTVTIHGGRVIGFANLYDMRVPESAFIGNVIVDKSTRGRGRGLGRRLLATMVNWCFQTYDLREAHISVFSATIPALLLYQRLGFAPYAMEARRDGRGRRTVMIHLSVTPSRFTRIEMEEYSD